jgi:hypothetical protein
MAKQHLKLAKEIQCRDFDALIAHTTIVFMRYMFLTYQSRMETDQRSFGDLFYACCEEVADISFMQALSHPDAGRLSAQTDGYLLRKDGGGSLRYDHG